MSITTYGLYNMKRSFLKILGKKVFEAGKKLTFEGRVLQKLMALNESDLHDSFLRVKNSSKKRVILKLCMMG